MADNSEQDSLQHLFKDIEEELKWQEPLADIAKTTENIFKKAGLTLAEGQSIVLQPLPNGEFLIYFTIQKDDCQFCGYNLVPSILEEHHIIPQALREKFKDSPLLDKLLHLCPNCHAELHTGMRNRIGETIDTKELQNFLKRHSYIRTSFVFGVGGLPPLV